MPFPPKIADSILVKCGRCCCICHKFCGVKMELNHIKPAADGGDDTEDNCIPLCFDCHGDVGHYNDRHPKGRKFTANELKGHRDEWYKKVARGGHQSGDDELREVDRKLFEEVRCILADSWPITFLRNGVVNFTYLDSRVVEITEFDVWRSGPEHEFFDPDIEAACGALHWALHRLRDHLATNTWYIREGFRGVPEEWEEEQPERFRSTMAELSEDVREIPRLYNEFIRCGRRKLAVI